MLTKQDKEEITNIIVETIKEVVLPVFETVATKEDLKKLATKEDLKGLSTQEDLDSVNARLDSIDRKLDRTFEKVLDHEDRLTAVEKIPVIAHQLKK